MLKSEGDEDNTATACMGAGSGGRYAARRMCGGEPAHAGACSDAPPAVMLESEGFIRCIHDPVMTREGDIYYVFSTDAHIMMICSNDMVTWEWKAAAR